MRWLLDTNVLLRLADAQSLEHVIALPAIERLLAGQKSVFISTQVLVEFWAVATRPESANGLGWSTATTAEAIRALRDQFPLLNETPEVWTVGSNWPTDFTSPASIPTTPGWQLCCSCAEFVDY
jgi:predicted nucleic acid-binding protein